MRPQHLLLIAPALLFSACGEATVTVAHPGEETTEFISKVHAVDKIYRSMRGPLDNRVVTLLPKGADPELLWITGFEAEMLDGEGNVVRSEEFMCHTNFDTNKPAIRLITLSQGQLEVGFPAGFGLPVMSDQPYRLAMQALNLNFPEGAGEVRHRIRIRFVRDSNLSREYTPLFVTGVYAVVSLTGEAEVYGTMENMGDMVEEATCLPGLAATTDTMEKDSMGRRFSGHYVVPPGEHTYRTRVTEQMSLRYDTLVHFIAVHVHPFSTSTSFRDLTTGETLFTAYATQREGRVGLSHVDHFSSEEGIALFRDHEYEIVSVYNNTTNEDSDSMAVLLLYSKWRNWADPRKALGGQR